MGQTNPYGPNQPLHPYHPSPRPRPLPHQVIAKAKVPIVKFEDAHTGYNFDLSFDVANGPEARERRGKGKETKMDQRQALSVRAALPWARMHGQAQPGSASPCAKAVVQEAGERSPQAGSGIP